MSKVTQDYIGRSAGNSIRYFPALAHALKSVNAGLMLSQLLYWEARGHRHDGYFFKTAGELYHETGLSIDKQDTARKLLLSKGLIATKLAGIPAKTHYLVNTAKVIDLLSTWQKNAPLDTRKALFKFPEKQVTITKTTQQTTQRPPRNDYQSLPQRPVEAYEHLLSASPEWYEDMFDDSDEY